MADVTTTAEYIWRRARELGVDPRAALGVAKFEGLNPNTLKSPTYGNPDAKGYSFGPFQLYSGSKDPSKIAPGGMAYEFLQKYGEAPSASNWQQQTDFALERMANKGFGAWYAVRDRGGLDKITAAGEKYAAKLGLTDGATAAPEQAPTGFAGQAANFLFGPPKPRSPDAFASDPPAGFLAQATGGLLGGGRAEPFSVGFDTPRPYQPAFAAPEQQYGAAFAGSPPNTSGGSATLTSLPPTIDAPAAGAAGIGSALASLGGALAKAGAAKEDMSWVQRPAETYRGKWDDEIFKRSIFGIRGLLG
jgi:hypothetical protein